MFRYVAGNFALIAWDEYGTISRAARKTVAEESTDRDRYLELHVRCDCKS